MGNHSDIEGFLSELVGKPEIELKDRDKKFLFKLQARAESISSLHRLFKKEYEGKLSSRDGVDYSQGIDALDTVYYVTIGLLSKTAVRKKIRKLVRFGLIEKVDKKSLMDVVLTDVVLTDVVLTDEVIFNAKLRRAELFRITEYGLFCLLSQEVPYPSELLSRHRRSKVMSTLLSSYFEEKTLVRLTTEMYFTIVRFLYEASRITIERLSKIEEAKKENDETERQDQVARLKDDLLWHAKSFVLRLLVDSASSNKDRRLRGRAILGELARDKKFCKLRDTAVREIRLSNYREGSRSLELQRDPLL